MNSANSPKPETINHEALADNNARVLDWLAFAGNDERKLLTILALNEADEPLGQTALSATVDKLAGDKVTGELKKLRQFCETTLGTVGAVESTDIIVISRNGGRYPGKGFYLNPKNKDFAVSFAGALTKWSYANPELSLSLLGSTQSNSPSDGARAPIRRFWALYELATHPDDQKSPALISVARDMGIDPSVNVNMLKRLKQKGIVSHNSSRKEHAREFTIIDPEQKENDRWTQDNITDATRLLFDGFKAAHAIKPDWQMDEFIGFLANNSGADAEQIKIARIRLQDSFAPNSTYLTKNIRVGDHQFNSGSRVELMPKYAEAIRDLVTIIDRFYSNDPEIMAEGTTAAEEIIHNHDAVTRLFLKGYIESKKPIDDVEFLEAMTSLIPKLGGSATMNALRDSYAVEFGRNISSVTFAQRMGALTVKGIVNFISVPQRVVVEPKRVYILTENSK